MWDDKQELPRSTEARPLPPPALRRRVSGTDDEQWFHDSGAQTVAEWMRALSVVGEKFETLGTIVDFGCGCGRAIRHLEQKINASQRLIGLDVDEEAISWLGSAFPKVTAERLTEAPAPVESESVDLILSHSVFTHLPEDVQFSWLADLARMLKRDGILIASVHGMHVFRGYRDSCIALGATGHLADLDRKMEADGFYHIRGRTESEASLPEYYGAAFHNINYITSNWTKSFALLAWLPVFALRHQDVLVLRKL